MDTHTYTKKELAKAYAPGLTPKAALNRLMLWINTNKQLSKALHRAGYNKMQKKFSDGQVSLIFKHLGVP